MNMPDINKKQINILVPLPIAARVHRIAERLKKPLAKIVVESLDFFSRNVTLEPDDLQWIAQEQEKNRIRRKAHQHRVPRKSRTSTESG